MQIVMQKASDVIVYRNDPKFLERQVWTNSADTDQNAARAVWSGCTLLQFRLHLLEASSFKFRVTTANVLGVRIFRSFTVINSYRNFASGCCFLSSTEVLWYVSYRIVCIMMYISYQMTAVSSQPYWIAIIGLYLCIGKQVLLITCSREKIMTENWTQLLHYPTEYLSWTLTQTFFRDTWATMAHLSEQL